MKRRLLLTPSFVVFSCFIIGGIIFKATSPKQCTSIRSDDSIFVLTGDQRRIPFAIRKMREFPDADLYIIGAGARQNEIELAQHAIIESKSKSTYQNALAIKNIAHQHDLRRVVLITTEDHMQRAKYLVHSELPNAEIISCPAVLIGMSPGKRLERWATEYIKYIVTLIGIKES